MDIKTKSDRAPRVLAQGKMNRVVRSFEGVDLHPTYSFEILAKNVMDKNSHYVTLVSFSTKPGSVLPQQFSLTGDMVYAMLLKLEQDHFTMIM